jgi:SAM-dependent methyltransferase
VSPGRRDHSDRRRAEGFGAEAARYDRVRPSYPDALIDELTGGRRPRVLDVGCGTGKAARLFAARGCRVLGVEVDPRMAEVARASGLEVEVGRFEEWQRAGREFDLVTSAQAWHWVNPEIGAERAAAALAPGGALALFWNYRRSVGPEADAALAAVYAQRAPDLATGPLLSGFDRSGETARHTGALAASGRFEPVETLSYRWERRYPLDDWLDLARTQSDHQTLDPEVREGLLDAVATTVTELGGSLLVDYETVCLRARVLAAPD